MTRLTCLFALLVSVQPLAAQTRQPFTGRLLSDVLSEMQAQGLKLVYSSELVRPSLRVIAEPRSRSPRRLLDEVLNPHGLGTRQGPNGTILVVKSTRVPAARKTPEANPEVGGVSGRVIDAGTGAPLAGVTVEVQTSGHSTRTDDQGGFVLAGVPAGRHALFVSTIGYALARPVVEVRANAEVTVVVPLAEGTGAYTERVTVTADRPSETDPALPAQQTLGSAALQSVRSVLVDDPFRAVQALPSVAANDDFRSDFSVRGADFGHLGTSIDGVTTPWLFHNFEGTEDSGSMATLNSDILDHVTLSLGAYPQRHGDRAGAWLDATMREGSRAAPAVRAAVSGTNLSLLGEGPLGGEHNGSWLVSFRRSYIDWLVRRVAPEFDSVFGFTDLQAKVVYDLTPRHQIQFTTVGGISRLQQTDANHPAETARAADDLVLGTVALRSTIASSAVLTQRTSVVAQRFRNLNPFGVARAEGDFQSLAYRADLAWRLRPAIALETGTMFERQQSARTTRDITLGPDLASPFLQRTDTFDGTGSVTSGYAHVVIGTGRRWQLSPGARLSHSTVTGETVASPWLQASWSLTGALSLRAGAGINHQFPELAQAYGPHAGVDLRSERSRHVDLALEHTITPSTEWQFTLYHRKDDRFLRRQAGEFRIVDGRLVVPQPDDPWANALDGESKGVELRLQRTSAHGMSGWISYAYGRTTYRDVLTGERFDGDFDQRHTVNAWLQYAMSSRTSVSGKLRFGSNFPLRGYFENRGGLLFVGERRNEIRVPAYARLDLRANRVFNYTKRRLTLFVEVMNVLNRDNFRAISPSIIVRTHQAVDTHQSLFPLLPSAGLLIEF